MHEARRIDTARRETAAFGTDVGAAVAREASVWVDTQRDLLTSFGSIMTDWLHRQSEAIDASSRSLQRLWECRNVADLFQTQQQLLTDYLRFTAGQIRAAGRDADEMTRKTARFAEAAGEETETLRRNGHRRRGAAESERGEAATAK